MDDVMKSDDVIILFLKNIILEFLRYFEVLRNCSKNRTLIKHKYSSKFIDSDWRNHEFVKHEEIREENPNYQE